MPFWQTMWTTQSLERHLSFIISGVNPSIVELDVVDGVQNPVFGIVSPKFLTGFDVVELGTMLKCFGPRMGLDFSTDAVEYLAERYRGHPLLTRMACSFLNTILSDRGEFRPIQIDGSRISAHEKEQDEEISFYCRHVTSELQSFYPNEYEMLEMLASGNVADFMELALHSDYVAHLNRYGLIKHGAGRPMIRISALIRFINRERARRDHSDPARYIVPKDFRSTWIRSRTARIAQDVRQLRKAAIPYKLPKLFEVGGFPEAERFCGLMVVETRDGFDNFINICNRCLVEPVERIGRAQGFRDYLRNHIKLRYPDFWSALRRIKLYRNDHLHIELNAHVDADLRDLLAQDLNGLRLTQIKEPYFTLQQIVIDELFIGLQCELDRLS